VHEEIVGVQDVKADL